MVGVNEVCRLVDGFVCDAAVSLQSPEEVCPFFGFCKPKKLSNVGSQGGIVRTLGLKAEFSRSRQRLLAKFRRDCCRAPSQMP